MSDRRRPTLSLTVTAETLAGVLMTAKERADAYFDGAPYEFLRCDAAPLARSFGGEVVQYEADVTVAAIPQRTSPPPWAAATATPDEVPLVEADEDEEVPIR